MPETERGSGGSPLPSSPSPARAAPFDALEPDVRRLAADIAPDGTARDLGGWMSRNLLLEPAGVVLRVHSPSVSHRRLLAVQRIRQGLADSGLTVPVAIARRGSTVFRCGDSWAEVESYLPHERLAGNWDSYAWMYRAMGDIHRHLRTLDLPAPRPPTAIFAAPNTLSGRLRNTESAIEGDAEAAQIARSLRALLGRLRRRWVSPTRLPRQLVHGDVKLENVGVGPSGETVYLDFGFVMHRPRIHDLAFSFTHSVLTVDGHIPTDADSFPWHRARQLITEYEDSAGSRLTAEERHALVPYIATVRIYQAAYAWFGPGPAEWLHNTAPGIRLSAWLLDHPEALSE